MSVITQAALGEKLLHATTSSSTWARTRSTSASTPPAFILTKLLLQESPPQRCKGSVWRTPRQQRQGDGRSRSTGSNRRRRIKQGPDDGRTGDHKASISTAHRGKSANS